MKLLCKVLGHKSSLENRLKYLHAYTLEGAMQNGGRLRAESFERLSKATDYNVCLRCHVEL